MKVTLLAYTQLNSEIVPNFELEVVEKWEDITDGQIVSLAAIRQCYSHKTALEVLETESEKYFGEKGKEAKRLFKQIVASKHTSTLEHLTFTFAIEGISRACLAQLTRHRVGFSYSVQSQRYVRFGSGDKTGGFDYVVPPSILDETKKGTFFDVESEDEVELTAREAFESYMREIQGMYDTLRRLGITAEDARMVLPNAAATNLVMTANLRALIDFYEKRKPGNGAQKEISDLAVELKNRIVEVEPWTEEFFE